MTHPCQEFVELYTGQENPFLTFVTLRKGEPGKPMYQQKWYDARPTLDVLNRTGSDIFFTVNCADGDGRRFENILAARVIFADYDAGVPSSWAIKPSILVESSPGKAQAYWMLDNLCLDFERWHAAERGVVWATGADKNVCDVARVLRLPGFVNHKYPGKPLSRMLFGEPTIHSLESIESAWAPIAAPAQLAAGCAVPTLEQVEKRRRYELWLRAAGAPTASSSGRLPVARNWLFRKAAMGVRDFDLPAAIVADVLAAQVAELQYSDALDFANDADRYATNVRGAAFVRHQAGTAVMV